ncbi:hypothetical protein P3T23_009427 [Paraburkholderia sp. GAS448]|uniref:hypothetical protein n=1 Tax=Paraburkholderia sp. GAS448 TaxID=3035136 RepID=UPI003D226619
MKTRTLSIACATIGAVLVAGCTAAYKNSDACAQMVRGKFAETSDQKLTISHTGVGINGTRVVVEGQFEPSAASLASEAAAASAVAAGASPDEVKEAAASAAAAVSASAASGAAAKPAGKKKKVVKGAAAECTFKGLNLTAFRWLAPAELAHPADTSGEAAE